MGQVSKYALDYFDKIRKNLGEQNLEAMKQKFNTEDLKALAQAETEAEAKSIIYKLNNDTMKPFMKQVIDGGREDLYDKLVSEFPLFNYKEDSRSFKELKTKSGKLFDGKDKPLQLSDAELKMWAREEGIPVNQLKELIDQKFSKQTQELASKSNIEREGDEKLAREYLLAKYDGDEAKMAEIEKELGDRAKYVLDNTEIPWYARATKTLADWTNGQSQTQKYRDQIANPTEEDNDSSNPFAGGRGRALVADIANGAMELADPAGRVKVAGSLITRGLKKGALAGLQGGAIETAREAIAGEDIDPAKIGNVAFSEATLPSVFQVGSRYLGTVPVVGRAISGMTRGMRKGSRADEVAGEIARRRDDAIEYIEQMKGSNGAYTATDNFNNLLDNNSLAKEFGDEYDNLVRDNVKRDVADGLNAEGSEQAFVKKFGTKEQYVSKKIAEDLEKTTEAVGEAGIKNFFTGEKEDKLVNQVLEDAELHDKSNAKTRSDFKTLQDLADSRYGDTDNSLIKTGEEMIEMQKPIHDKMHREAWEKASKNNPYTEKLMQASDAWADRSKKLTHPNYALEQMGGRVPVVIANTMSKEANDNATYERAKENVKKHNAEYRKKQVVNENHEKLKEMARLVKLAKERGWDKGFARSWEERQSPDYIKWSKMNTNAVMGVEDDD